MPALQSFKEERTTNVITTDTDIAIGSFDVLVRVGKFPTAGRKLVIQKGTTVISITADDVLPFLSACADVAQDLND
jgi:hypothetical protein